jgi:hypothetical protein
MYALPPNLMSIVYEYHPLVQTRIALAGQPIKPFLLPVKSDRQQYVIDCCIDCASALPCTMDEDGFWVVLHRGSHSFMRQLVKHRAYPKVDKYGPWVENRMEQNKFDRYDIEFDELQFHNPSKYRQIFAR